MDTQWLVVYGTAFLLGAAHAFEPDHMAAVTTFVARRPSPRQAASFGMQWAIGHGFSLLLIGLVLFALKLAISETASGWLEKLVGFALLGLGIWTLLQLMPGHGHHTHDHHHGDEIVDVNGKISTHTHADGTTHSHSGRGSLWMGMLHGAAGTAAFVGQALVAVSQTYSAVILYTLFFSIGVLMSMTAYAGVLGGAITWGGKRLYALSTGAQVLAGTLACVVGFCWIQGIEIPWFHF